MTLTQMLDDDELWIPKRTYKPCRQCGKPAPSLGYFVLKFILATMMPRPICSRECILREVEKYA